MRKAKTKVSVHTTEADYLAISRHASQIQLTISCFMRLAALEKAEIRPFFSEEDLNVLWFLRNELKEEALQLMDGIRALNRGEANVEDNIKSDILAIYRTVAALCIELRSCVRMGTGLQLGASDAAN